MEINAATTGGQAAASLIGGLAGDTKTQAASKLTAEQQQAVTVAVATLLAQAGISDADPVEVHYAASVEGKWAVLRVASVLVEE